MTTSGQPTYRVGDPAGLPRLVAAADPVGHPRRAFVAQIMGLPVSVHVRGPRAKGTDAAAAVERAFDRLRADERMFSTYLADSAVSRIRRGDLSIQEADPRVRRVAALCEVAAARTVGAFSAWLPGPDGSALFDPTGLVKGWAVERAVDGLTRELAGLGPHDLLVSAGGDVLVGCERTDTPDWAVGVEDPRDRSRLLLSIPLRRGAVATSGTAARGSHIVDPATGEAATELLSATVIGPSLTWADVYATAAFVRGADAVEWIITLPDYTGLVVSADGTTQFARAAPP